MLAANLEITASIADAVEQGGLPRVFVMVTNPLDVLTEYLTRRWEGRPVNVMGSGTCLDTLRFTELLARECGVHPRSVHAWVIGEHGDSAVFLHSSATIGAIPFPTYAAQRHLAATREWQQYIEREVRTAAYQVRDLKGASVQGIGLTVSGLVHALVHEVGALIPVSTRIDDGLCASLPCVLGPDGPSAPLWPSMTPGERSAWDKSIAVLADANKLLPI